MPEVRLSGGALDGLDLHWIGKGRGPAVVFLHGLGGFAESWRPTMAALARRHTVLAVDLPGCGRSAKPAGRYDLEFFADAVHGCLDALGIAQATLVGHSLGGAVAVTCALRRPSRVERLALVSALVPGFYEPSLGYRLAASPGLGDLLALVRSARLYRRALSRCFHVPAPEHVAFLVEHDWAERTCLAARLAFLRTLRHCRDDLVRRAAAYRRAIATLDLPVLVVHGRHDRVIPADACRRAAAAFPRAELRWLEACGHFPHLECPDVVNEWLAAFAAERPAAR